MKLLLLDATEFRGSVIKNGEKADIPDGAAHRLIATGAAVKISDAEFEEKKAGNGKPKKNKANS